jgi:hypothetical protein
LTQRRIVRILLDMRTASRLLLLLLAGLALAVPAIAATYSTGKYTGTTSQRNQNTHKFRKITLHADSTAGRVSNIKFVSRGKCNDNTHSEGSQGKGDNKLFADVDDNGHFSLFAPSKTGATKLTMDGDLSGDQASGTFTVKSRFDKNSKPDPHGSIKCTTGTVHWSAKLTG